MKSRRLPMHVTRLLVAAAVAALSLPSVARAQSADRFPLAAGDTWDYEIVGGGDAHVEVGARKLDPVLGRAWFRLDGYLDAAHWVREAADGRVLEFPDRAWYSLGARKGARFAMVADDGVPVAPGGATGSLRTTFKVISRSETVSVPAGVFRDCVHIERVWNPQDSQDLSHEVEAEWFAPGVGL